MKALIAGLATLALVGAACGDDDDTSDALSAVCDQQEAVIENLAALVALDPATNTTGDYQSAADELRSSVEDLESAQDQLTEQDVSNVQQAFDDLRSSLESLDEVVLSEAGDEVAGAVEAQSEALQEMYVTAYANSSCAPEAEEEE